ncbi:MAG: MarC family protein [Proteobacteria bacterium]|nr:MarC family protein [Pseudomonadota bacterium]MBU4419391.1 MarC family protein [Pseudomonadota bacterium]MBU4503515.1 MarC family protein [Pseudomonadota bacterium]MCG2831114.1 MarC family protein [Desulfobacteraceae bacterium]
METLQQFITILIPLIIITDPPGNLPFFLLFTEQNTLDERRKMAAIASSSAALILIFFALTGDFVLRFFNIGLPAFQLAGGFIFFIYALQMLCLIPSNIKATQQEEKEGIEKQNVALVPLATPLIAGPGAITAVLVWRHNPESSLSTPLLLLAIIIACLLIYIVFYFGEWIRKMLGVGGIRVVSRLMGLLLAVIAVQFMVTGFQQLC